MLQIVMSVFFAFIEWDKYLPSVINVVGGGGLLTAVYMLMKFRPEAGQMTVVAAQGAIIVQTGVIENLNKELKRVTDENAQLRVSLEHEIVERRKLKELLAEEIDKREQLQEKLSSVEAQLNRLTSRTTTLETK